MVRGRLPGTSKRPKRQVKKKETPEEVVRSVVRIQARYALAMRIVTWAGIIGGLYVGIALPVKYSAGQNTVLTIIHRVAVGLHFEFVIPVAVASLFAALWQRERRIRIGAVRREHERVAQLEVRLDPERTSSGFKE
jgi:hypothetical protein